MRRLVLLVAGLFGVSTPAAADEVPEANRRSVKWDIDHAMKWVTVRVRISYYHENAAEAAVTPAEMAAMNAALVRAWEGMPVNCYKLHVILRTDIVSGIAAVPEDSIGIRLVYTPYWVEKFGEPGVQHEVMPYTRSKIETAVYGKVDYLSDDPSARGWPTTGTYHKKNPEGQNRLWVRDPRNLNMSHEFGHILGLQDNYDEKFKLRPGAVNDLMADGGDLGPKRLFPESITKAVRRGGIDFSDLRCSRHLESEPFDMSLHAPLGEIGLSDVQVIADNCDWIPPSNDPERKQEPNHWKGTFQYSPHMNTPEQVGEFTIDPVFQAGGEVVKDIDFTTLSSRVIDPPNPQERWWTWETVKLYDDRDITASVDLQLRATDRAPEAEKFTVHAHWGDSKTGQFAYAADKPIEVEVRGACEK